MEGPALVQVQNHRPANTVSRKNAVGAAELTASAAREPRLIQQMQFINFPQTFDSNHVVFPLHVGGNALVLMYLIGVFGLLISFSVVRVSAGGMFYLRARCALLCTVIFVAPFAALYQRGLFKLLVTSFDFLFYVLQTTAATVSACMMYNWEISRCMILFTWWIWIQWALLLDALTPVMRDKLRFRLRLAAPVVALVLFGHIGIISRIFFVGEEEVHDAVMYRGVIWDHELVVRVMPFYFSRIVTLCLWCPRLIWRFCTASNSEVSIIRGRVCYDNFFAKRGRRRSRKSMTKCIHNKRQQWILHGDRRPQSGPPPKLLY
ncbi:unnamed protein product [Phytophthora fragariaefolia]|uniref:Unnamed protein product n=1 Tax=Phytophthora fragariaefolia TaxID=1490495 RepID=A0A9W6TZ30_9STRA|nr:unnamed protein product [Phytophthora fragariaefolia]